MPEEYQVLYPSPTTEKEILASVVIDDGVGEREKREIRAALREVAALSLATRGITNVIPGSRTVRINEPRRFNELEEDGGFQAPIQTKVVDLVSLRDGKGDM